MIQLFTDSAANLTEQLANEYNISVIPLSYTMGGEQKNQLDDFDGKAFYDALRAGEVVKTSMINIAAFTDRFENELRVGNDILYIGLSGGVSGTTNAAQMAANELHGEYPERRIEVIDSRGASLGEGMIVLEAAKMLRSGADLDEVTARVKELIPNMCQCFTVDDLNYLKRSGRISGAAALIGGILGIRPLLIGDDEGRIVMYDKIRGAKRALDALAERYARLVTDKAREIGIAHADNEGGVAYLLGKLREHGFCGKELTVCYEPVTGAHVGPGTVALFFYGKSRVL